MAGCTGLSLPAIRYYDEGLVIPSGRAQGGFRLAAEADVSRLFAGAAEKVAGIVRRREA